MTPSGSDRDVASADALGDSTLDACFELLAHRNRRLLLSTLAETGDDRLPLGVLTDQIVSKRVGAVDHESIVTELHHVHLPKLEAEGVLEYDADRSMVLYRGDERIERFLHAVEQAGAD
ncbi:DUF7344 domain-containing protein [Halorientalis halophila]|uniref:DUF7344 domain-containing protein n=1 Tax=Halorientalis halophila TaxID=3108499 RepID=UPI00300A56D6